MQKSVTEVSKQVAAVVGISAERVAAVMALLDEGQTLPFIARYRKERTGGTDELTLRRVADELERVRTLTARRNSVLEKLKSRGLLTPLLQTQLAACRTIAEIDDLYQPFRNPRKTRADLARDAGLQPLADILLKQRGFDGSPDALLNRFATASSKNLSKEEAIQGGCDIVAETWAADQTTRKRIRRQLQHGRLECGVRRGKSRPDSRFRDYYDHTESVSRVPGHRLLAMLRGVAEGELRLRIRPDEARCIRELEERLLTNHRFPFYSRLRSTVADCFRRLLRPAAESYVLGELKARAEQAAISVFAVNLKNLLMAAPVGPHITLGIDPGFRTGCKLAVVDANGRFLEHSVIYPTPPHSKVEAAERTLADLIRRHQVEFIAIGNGTASRETDQFVDGVIRRRDLKVTRVVVSEAGASVYSASEAAAEEYPDLDVTIRGAVSIAHRLQDPLAELVKLDPRSIGVGQYQHDVDQKQLQQALEREVESCVNQVGVPLNSAGSSLLRYVAGIGDGLAKSIVQHRESNGPFRTRSDLLKVPRLGPKAFEQAAGFLRIPDGPDPLDNSAVHPERYRLVQTVAAAADMPLSSLIGNATAVEGIDASRWTSEECGADTMADILSELARPGRDPRGRFEPVEFDSSVSTPDDLSVGMRLNGIITNVTDFGAFCDVGVHQDGLIHISELTDRFVRHPSEVVTVGDRVRVEVLSIDSERRRISLRRVS